MSYSSTGLEKITPYRTPDSKKKQVEQMFDNIAPKYDLLNHLLSFGIDYLWRKKAIDELKSTRPRHILDVATGTADMAIEAMRLDPETVTGIDLSAKMIELGREKLNRKQLQSKIKLIQGDSESLPFADESFDAVTVAYGVRNFENLDAGLYEMFRVLKRGGKAVILEFAKPDKFPVKQLFNFYFRYALPTIGSLISKDKYAYRYLPESVNHFPEGEAFLSILKRAGFKNTICKKLTFGICCIYTGEK